MNPSRDEVQDELDAWQALRVEALDLIEDSSAPVMPELPAAAGETPLPPDSTSHP